MAFDIDLNDLTLENIGSWPNPIKMSAYALVAVVLIGFLYWFDTHDLLLTLSATQDREVHLRASFEHKQQLAANLQGYKLHLIKIRKQFASMLRQLPSKTEIPDLLEDISKTGVASGLEFQLFDPQQEQQHEFYADLPIKMIVLGDYHKFGEFISRVAGLPRIVTIQNFSIQATKPLFDKSNVPETNLTTQHHLVMHVTAKTYRYIDSNIGL